MFPDTPIVPKLANEPEPTPEPTPQPSPEPSPEPTPEPQPEPGPDGEQAKKNLDFRPLMSFTGLAEVFPFCLPWDMVNFFKSLNAPRQTPRIEVKLAPILYNSTFVIDLTPWESIAALVRNLVVGLFILGLILVSRNMIKW